MNDKLGGQVLQKSLTNLELKLVWYIVVKELFKHGSIYSTSYILSPLKVLYIESKYFLPLKIDIFLICMF